MCKFKTSKTLPCLHIFCLRCIDHITDNAHNILCPLCRQTSIRKINCLPTNFTLVHIKELISVELKDERAQKSSTNIGLIRQKKKTGACVCWGSQLMVDWYCHDCVRYYCTNCNQPELLVNHRIFYLSEQSRSTQIKCINDVNISAFHRFLTFIRRTSITSPKRWFSFAYTTLLNCVNRWKVLAQHVLAYCLQLSAVV